MRGFSCQTWRREACLLWQVPHLKAIEGRLCDVEDAIAICQGVKHFVMPEGPLWQAWAARSLLLGQKVMAIQASMLSKPMQMQKRATQSRQL